MSILNDWHYADIKRAISENTHLQFRNVRVGSNINLKTFNPLKEAERENLSIFKELYKEGPAPVNQTVAQVPEPAPPTGEERQEEN